VLHNDAGGTTSFLAGMGTKVDGLAAGSSVAGFAIVVVAIVLIAGALGVLLELWMRMAAVYVAVLFLPIVLAGLVWPATARWARRLVELLTVLILSKFIIVAVLSLAASALASGFAGGDLAALLGGAALLLLAAFAPYTLLRLAPIVEAGAAAHLEGAGAAVTGRARGALEAPGNVIQGLLHGHPPSTVGREDEVLDARTAEGAAKLSADPSSGSPYVVDPSLFATTRGAGLTADGAEATRGGGLVGVGAAAAFAASRGVDRAASTADRLVDDGQTDER